MRLPMIWDGTAWRDATMEEYNNVIINVPVYGKANYVVPSVWNLPIVNTDVTTGSKVVASGKSIQFRFSCARNTDVAQAVRAYKLALDKNPKAGVRFNYTDVNHIFTFETTFCGSGSGLKKFEGFINKLASITSIKSLYVRFRDETTKEVSKFKKFDYNNTTLSIVRYLRDKAKLQTYNNLTISKLEIVPYDNIYGLIIKLPK